MYFVDDRLDTDPPGVLTEPETSRVQPAKHGKPHLVLRRTIA